MSWTGVEASQSVMKERERDRERSRLSQQQIGMSSATATSIIKNNVCVMYYVCKVAVTLVGMPAARVCTNDIKLSRDVRGKSSLPVRKMIRTCCIMVGTLIPACICEHRKDLAGEETPPLYHRSVFVDCCRQQFFIHHTIGTYLRASGPIAPCCKSSTK